MSVLLPNSKFDIILTDPPWEYYGDGKKWAACAKFYNCIPDGELLKLDMASILNERGILFVWSTCPRLDFAIKCIESWGLFYRGVAFVWVKTTQKGAPIKAQGVRPSIIKPLTELVLVASNVKRGRPIPLASESVCQTVFAPVTAHSQKPEEVQRRIELLYPNATKCEMFARRIRSGWYTLGLEVEEVAKSHNSSLEKQGI